MDCEFLRKIFVYQNGNLLWKSKIPKSRVEIGSIAGCIDTDGYRKIQVNGKSYRAHHLIWCFVHGSMPDAEVDHINHIRDDNRIENLRPCVRRENSYNRAISKNNKSGYKGVSFAKSMPDKCWYASIKIDGKSRNLGYYETPELAHNAYKSAAIAAFGNFAHY